MQSTRGAGGVQHQDEELELDAELGTEAARKFPSGVKVVVMGFIDLL